ncbi:MAG: ABC transporter ATP-binding protein [Lachnospiraceae bacterium]|jgi:Fe-S cluster assembly ATP-binding protein
MLELKNVSFEVNDEDVSKEIIKDVSFTVDNKKFIAITGPNGGGKSTLAKLIAGIYKPIGGRIFFKGADITDMGITERAKAGIGFAFQQPVRFKGIQVKDLISFAAGNDITIAGACEYLSEVGLCAKDYIYRDVDASLSGGEIKRIEIATLLARKPGLAVLDEPEAGIDLWSFSNLIKIFEKMRAERERSVIVISHQERILEIADEIVVIKDGRIVAQGVKDSILPELLLGTKGCKFYQD